MERENPEVNTAPDQALLRLTDKAVEQVKAILAREKLDGYGLRVGVAGGGCSGFSYGLDFEKDPRPEDSVLEFGGVKVYVDRANAKYLGGTVIDFVSGWQGAGFKFLNPNVSGTCGCGTSFSV